MKTKYAWISILMSLALVLGVAGNALSYTNTGQWMFTESGNDSNTDISVLEGLIEGWFDDNGYAGANYDEIGLAEYAKVDEPDTTNGGLTLEYDGDNFSGTWETDAPVNFYSVKAANEFAFYWVDPAAISGEWDTSKLSAGNGNQPAISHVTTWIMNGGGPGPGPEPIPEPSTVFLMGLGLAGMGVTVRKRKRK